MVTIKNTFEHVKGEGISAHEKRNVSPMTPHIVRFVQGVRSASRPRTSAEKHAQTSENPEHILVIEFDSANATDTPGGPKNSMSVAADSIQRSIIAVVARRETGEDHNVMQSLPNYVDRLGLVKTELKHDQWDCMDLVTKSLVLTKAESCKKARRCHFCIGVFEIGNAQGEEEDW